MTIAANTILLFYIFTLGAVLASFINVVIWRLPRNMSVSKGRSFCPSCCTGLVWYDLIPIASWAALKGKCRYCNTAISARYPIIESLGGSLAILAYFQSGIAVRTLLHICALLVLLAITMIDLDTMTIPNVLVLALFLIGLISIIAVPDIHWISRLIGALCVSLPMLLLTLFIEGSFGGGDIKLMFAAGILMGWENTLLAAFIGILTGGIYAFYILLRKKADRKSHFAFGPFLSFGIAASLLYGNEIIRLYLYMTQEWIVSLLI